MRSFFHYLNWALHYFNKFIWYYLKSFGLSFLGLVIFLAIPFSVVWVSDNFDYAVLALIIETILGMFVLITILIYQEPVEDTTVLYDPETLVWMKDTKYTIPKTRTQILKESLAWTLIGLTFLVCLLILIGSSL